jgi:hypothetical protein
VVDGSGVDLEMRHLVRDPRATAVHLDTLAIDGVATMLEAMLGIAVPTTPSGSSTRAPVAIPSSSRRCAAS